jgi:hypothetical protein
MKADEARPRRATDSRRRSALRQAADIITLHIDTASHIEMTLHIEPNELPADIAGAI